MEFFTLFPALTSCIPPPPFSFASCSNAQLRNLSGCFVHVNNSQFPKWGCKFIDLHLIAPYTGRFWVYIIDLHLHPKIFLPSQCNLLKFGGTIPIFLFIYSFTNTRHSFTHTFIIFTEARSRFPHPSRSAEGSPLGYRVRIRTRACHMNSRPTHFYLSYTAPES